MRRKLIMAAMAVMLPIGFLATIGTGVASAKGSTTFDGNISCNLQGSVSVKPAITSTSVGPYTVKAKLTNNKCIGLAGTSTTQNGETIISSTEALTFTVPVSSPPTAGCSALLTGGAGSFTVPSITVKWKGTSKITSTVLGSSGVTITPGSPDSIISLGGSVTSGWSSPATYQISLGTNTAALAAACVSKKGLSKFTVDDNGGDNLEIGPAF